MTGTSRLDDAHDRQAIRDNLDATLIVEAAAGTGKTTELVTRIVEVLATGRAPVQQIVAVTFTEKAAGELKLRLREALDRARNRPGPKPGTCVTTNGSETSTAVAGSGRAGSPTRQPRWGAEAGTDRAARLEDALAHLEEAHVSTIHGFCAELLRERPVEAKVDPRFEVMLEPDARRLYRRAFDDWLQAELEDPPEGVRRSLRRRAGSDEDGPRARLREAGWTLACWRDFPAAWRRDGFDRDAALDDLVRTLHRFADLSVAAGRQTDNLYQDTWAARDLSSRVRAMDAAGRQDPDGIEAALVDLSRDTIFTRPRKGYGAKYGEGVARTAVQEAHAALLEALRAFRDAADADLAALLQRELSAANIRYEQLKQESGRLDFVDLLLRARDLVRDNDEVRAAFQQRFVRIFVDEFQDTDPLQAELLMLLASDDAGVRDWRRIRPLPGKLFVVGDPKQSIYRFRRADVGTYQEVKDQLLAHGAQPVRLRTSFRSLPAIQRVVNAAFSPQMQGDRQTLQADYVPLMPYRAPSVDQPSVVALPVPRPYGARRISAKAIDASLPDAVCAFIDWLVKESGWTITEREEGWREREALDGGRTDEGKRVVRVSPRHICVLFRRFETYGADVTRPYVEGLQARGIPHLLVGGRSFHEREEVEAMRAALTAIEWPDSALDVFATVHGPLFAVPDEALLEYRERFGRLHPFRLPSEQVPDHLAPVVDALRVLRALHASRNHVPVTETIERLLAATRAHAGLVLRRSGEQALANVLQLAELARAYELSDDASSFRGFIDLLEEEADAGESPEAPILEEGAEGVRVMTVHRAKGLEFPVVILADMTASLTHGRASRYLDAGRGLCAVRIGGWSPRELVEHEEEELARDGVEAVRVAYVAATRARDLLVIPAVGDKPYDDKWLSPLNAAIYPPVGVRRTAVSVPACPQFGKDTVLTRPDGDPATSETVCPGLHRFGASEADAYAVVWWDPRMLALDAPTPHGLRAEDLVGKDADAALVEADMREYEAWKAEREETLARAGAPSVVVRAATAHATMGTRDRARGADVGSGLPAGTHLTGDKLWDPASAGFEGAPEPVEVVDVRLRPSGKTARGNAALQPSDTPPVGARLGTLTHAVLASAPLDANAQTIEQVATLQARIVGATESECQAAASMAAAALAHPLLERARVAEREGRCRRETPVTIFDGGVLIEGVVDLAFEEPDGWTVIDFKTARELERGLEIYTRQVALYARAIAAATGRPVRGVLMYV
jgi:ATP-dependent helicase/nuclease subunit A